MCGIFGIVTEKEQTLGPILIEAAGPLQYAALGLFSFVGLNILPGQVSY